MWQYEEVQELLKNLDKKDWRNSVPEIKKLLQKELQKKYGGTLIKDYRDNYEVTRIKEIDDLKVKLIKKKSFSTLDKDINDFTSEIGKINDNVQHLIKYNLLEFVSQLDRKNKKKYPFSSLIADHIFNKNDLSKIIKTRILSIFNDVVFQSANNSSKSNAGNAGELFVEVILLVAGLEEGVTLKKQHASRSGSDTDFVTPYVEDLDDNSVDNSIAVQFSSNDRLRLISSELVKKSTKYCVIGSGLDASSKELSEIGIQILRKINSDGVKLVCYKRERDKLLRKLKNAESKDDKDKYNFFKSNSMSFSTFAMRLHKQYSSRT